jgi:bacterioferritin-associated ferredoxin
MYVCLCRAVTDHRIREAIDSGASTTEEVTQACGAGGDCGACAGYIEELIEDAQDSTERPHVAACRLSRGRAA